MLSCIGELYDEWEGDSEICGCVCSPRKFKNKLALWTRSCLKEDVQVGIGKKWKELCEYDPKSFISYQVCVCFYCARSAYADGK